MTFHFVDSVGNYRYVFNIKGNKNMNEFRTSKTYSYDSN